MQERARVVDGYVVQIARSMIDGAWTPEARDAWAERCKVTPNAVDEWASDAGRIIRISADLETLRAVNVRRLDETYARAADPRAAVAAIAEQNRMLGLHAPERSMVTVQTQSYEGLSGPELRAELVRRRDEYERAIAWLDAQSRTVEAPALPAGGTDER